MKISFIGTGKAATALAKAVIEAGNEVFQAWAHTAASADAFHHRFDVPVILETSKWQEGSDIVLVALKDDVAGRVASGFRFTNEVVALTSGIQSKEVLRLCSAHFGIFYPFVSMTKDTAVNFREAMLMIEGNDLVAQAKLRLLAAQLSDHVVEKGEQDRQMLHVAAVLSQNFTNHLWAISTQLLKENGLSFDLLKPLLEEHFRQVMQHDARMLQTGPAIRGDETTIRIHEKLLSKNQDWLKVYEVLTASIQATNKNEGIL